VDTLKEVMVISTSIHMKETAYLGKETVTTACQQKSSNSYCDIDNTVYIHIVQKDLRSYMAPVHSTSVSVQLVFLIFFGNSSGELGKVTEKIDSQVRLRKR
jgi:hypothetical protein